MSVSELYQTLYVVLEAADRLIEFWLSASFAIVVATFLAAGRLNKALFGLITVTYTLVSVQMFLRWWLNLTKFVEIRTQLIDRGEPYNLILSISGGYIQIAIFVIGTFGTLYFVWHTYRQGGRDA